MSLLRPNIAAMQGYVPGYQPPDIASWIKLNTNENPYGPSPKVNATLKRAVNSSLRLYPEPQSDTLRAAAARVYGVKPANIIVGNGSDEILSMLLRCFVGPGDRAGEPRADGQAEPVRSLDPRPPDHGRSRHSAGKTH